MNFQHTEERQMLADVLGRFIERDYDIETRNKIAGSEQGYSPEKWAQISELGILGALFAEQDGGFGGSGFDIAVVFEQLGRGLVLEPVRGSALLAATALHESGDPASKPLFEALMEGSTIAAFAHFEPESRYDPAWVTTNAHRDGDSWVLNGCKANIAQGPSASVFIVSTRTDKAKGLSFLKVPADAQGVSVKDYASIDGGRVADLKFDNVQLPADALVGREGKAGAVVERVLARGVLSLCAEAVGAMDETLALTLEYLKTRKQFGVPIGSFQALQHRMATMSIEVEQARSAMINASATLDGEDLIAIQKAVSAAKYLAGKVGLLVAEEAVQMHGAMGMTWELPVSHFAKRLMMIDHELGDADYHLNRFMTLGRG